MKSKNMILVVVLTMAMMSSVSATPGQSTTVGADSYAVIDGNDYNGTVTVQQEMTVLFNVTLVNVTNIYLVPVQTGIQYSITEVTGDGESTQHYEIPTPVVIDNDNENTNTININSSDPNSSAYHNPWIIWITFGIIVISFFWKVGERKAESDYTPFRGTRGRAPLAGY